MAVIFQVCLALSKKLSPRKCIALKSMALSMLPLRKNAPKRRHSWGEPPSACDIACAINKRG